MKKKLGIALLAEALALVIAALWYKAPIDLMDLDHEQVMEIVVFNGNSGKATHITGREEIRHIIENLNQVEIRRGKPSVGYMGYSFKLTVYMSDGEEAGDWNNFIVNSEDIIRKDPFFYSVTEGSIDYGYIESVVE